MTSLALSAVALVLAADPAPYARAQRVAYLEAALEAVRGARPELLTQGAEYAGVMERGACASPAVRLKVECLMTAARKFCKGKEASCPAVMDVVVSNALAEGQLVSTERRYDIMREHRDWRAELARELRRLQGSLAVDFKLRTAGAPAADSLGSRIDGYCVAAADKSHLAWQVCASSLVWFIGRAPREAP